jgi:hypothetical protein
MRTAILCTYATALLAAAPCFAQEHFDTPDAAVQAVIDAAEKHDTARLNAIFGPQGGQILTSGNAEQDRGEQSEFARLARGKHQIIPDKRDPNRAILSVGDEDWPFPVPIVRTNGKWSFDPSETRVEMQARRIGTDELDAIEICSSYVDAQRKYASEDRDKDGLLEYARRMMSSPGKRDGLYWGEEADSLVPLGLAKATMESANASPKAYHGYYFRILEGQGSHATGGAHTYVAKDNLIGGFGLIAWPAQYGVTGVHTFMVNQDGVVYQKDIAPPPAGTPAPVIRRFDPDPSWSQAE